MPIRPLFSPLCDYAIIGRFQLQWKNCWPSAVLASRVVTDGISFSLPYRSVKVMVRVRKKERERGERLAI